MTSRGGFAIHTRYDIWYLSVRLCLEGVCSKTQKANVILGIRNMSWNVQHHKTHELRLAAPREGFYLVVTAFLCCLDDTRLQSPDPLFASRPFDLFPLRRRVGGCTHRLLHVHLHFLLRRFCKFFRQP